MRLKVVILVVWTGLINIACGLRLPSNLNVFFASRQPIAINAVNSDGKDGAIPTPPPTAGPTEFTAFTGMDCLRRATVLVSFPAIGTRNTTLKTTAPLKFLPLRPPTWAQDWWKQSSQLRSSISPVIFPFFAKHVQKVAGYAPMVTERLSPYINPPFGYWMALKLLQPNRGNLLSYGVLRASMVMGALCMVKDMYIGGLGRRDLAPYNDSYAVVTGAVDGIGREMSHQLYQHGYNLVLVDDSPEALHVLQKQLRARGIATSEQPRTGLYYLQKLRKGLLCALVPVKSLHTTNTPPILSVDTKNNTTTLAVGVSASASASASTSSPATGRRWLRYSNTGRAPASLLTTTPTPAGTEDIGPMVLLACPVQEPPSIDLIVSNYAKPTAPFDVLKELKKRNLHNKIEILVNAAEHRRASPLLSTPPRSLQRMLHANIHYTVTLTRLLAPLIIQRTSRSRTQLRSPQYSTPAIRTVADNTTVDLNIGGGRILFVDSLLSKGPATGNSLYAASKAFMSYFAQSLRRELLPQGVPVTVATLGGVRYPSMNTFKQRHNGVALLCGGQDDHSDESHDTSDKYSGEVDNVCTSSNSTTGIHMSSLVTTADSDGAFIEGQSSDIDHNIIVAPVRVDTSNFCVGARDLTTATDTTTPKKSLIHSLPGCSISSDEAGRKVFAALRAGRDATTPGIANKLYRYGISQVLPAPVIASLAKIALTPLPEWTYRRHESFDRSKSNVFGFSSLLLLQRGDDTSTGRLSAHTCVAIATSLLTQHLNAPIRVLLISSIKQPFPAKLPHHYCSCFLHFYISASSSDMLFFSLVVCCVLGLSLAGGFSKKSYSCVDGSCQLNAQGTAGPAHGICLSTCGAGNLWPYPSGDVAISSGYEHINLKSISFEGGSSEIDRKIEQNFLASIASLGKPTQKSSQSSILVEYTVKDKSVTIPSISNDESYDISVTADGGKVVVSIQGQTIFGVRHGFETLSQLISFDYFSDSLVIPSSVSIRDKPTFAYRGVMVDVARNFMSVDKLKETVRAMGYNKLNVLHLHISDTASFPLEIATQPNVTAYGAYDAAHVYSVSEVQDLVQFAHAHGVMILPEVDMPAHVSAGWQWGPEAGLGEFIVCADPDGTHSTQFLTDSLEPPSGQLNVVNENVYPVLRDIYKTVASLFQSDFFHLGGDEVIVGSDEAWAACYNSTDLGKPILDYLAQNGLSRADTRTFYALWNNFTMRATSMVQDIYKTKEGLLPEQILKKIHVWGGSGNDPAGVTYNMMLEPKLKSILPPELFTVQVWDASDDSITKTLIEKGYDVILSNQDYVYLDCGNAGFTNAGGYWCQPYHEWYHIYDYIRDITEKWNLSEAQLARVQGSETLIWAEMVDDQNLSQKLWPRSAALAEALWSSNYLSDTAAAAHVARVAKSNAAAKVTTKQARNAATKVSEEDKVERSWFEAAGRMLHWRELLVQRGVAAEALMPRWCSQRDPYACYVNAGIPQ